MAELKAVRIPVDATELTEAFAAINEATRKAHELIADMRAERALLAADLKAVHDARAGLRDDINEQSSELIGECVAAHLAEFEPSVKAQMDRSVAKVDESFTRLQNIYLCGNGPDPKPIEDMVIQKIAALIVERRGL